MIDEEATKEAFGYYSKDLKPKSNNPVLVSCKSCGKIRKNRFGYLHPLCRSCSKTGNRSPNFKKYGSKNPNWRGGPKKCICKKCGKIFYVDQCQKGEFCSRSCTSKARIHTEETKAKMSAAHKGDKHWNWLGGISPKQYCSKFNKSYREKIRIRFGNKCFLCSKSEEDNGEALSVHHVNYNKDCGCDNTKCICVPLCRSCHLKTNTNRNYWKKKIMNILKQL